MYYAPLLIGLWVMNRSLCGSSCPDRHERAGGGVGWSQAGPGGLGRAGGGGGGKATTTAKKKTLLFFPPAMFFFFFSAWHIIMAAKSMAWHSSRAWSRLSALSVVD